jgi:sarcosine oxidase
VRALGIEQHHVGHARGSSHGRSRVIRKAYYEDPRYVPLLERAYALWAELERESGETLLTRTGCLHLGPPAHPGIAGVLASVARHGLAHELLDGDALARRFPAFRLAPDDIGVFEADGGILAPERCVLAQAAAARARGATILEGERALSIRAGVVETDRGRHTAATIVLAQGPWLRLPAVSVERQVQLWFAPRRPVDVPVFLHFDGDRMIYGLPPTGLPALKLCRHHGGAPADPDVLDRAVRAGDEADVRGWIRAHLPGADGPLVDAAVCMYDNSPDGHFLVGPHPELPRVLVAGGFSGHGFKLAPVVGEIVADLATRGRTGHDIGMFDPARFAG